MSSSVCLLLPNDRRLVGDAQQNDPDAHGGQTAQHGQAVGRSQSRPLPEQQRRGQNDAWGERHVVDGLEHVGAETLQGLVDEVELRQYADGQNRHQAREQSQGPAAPWRGPLAEDVRRDQAEPFAARNGEASQEGANGHVHHDVGRAVSRSDPHDEREQQQDHQDDVRHEHCGITTVTSDDIMLQIISRLRRFSLTCMQLYSLFHFKWFQRSYLHTCVN